MLSKTLKSEWFTGRPSHRPEAFGKALEEALGEAAAEAETVDPTIFVQRTKNP
jgi:hypothetical protein